MKAICQTIGVIRLKSFSQLATVLGSVVDSIASGVYRVGASMRVDLEYTDLEYTEMVLTAEHPLQHLDIPEMN